MAAIPAETKTKPLSKPDRALTADVARDAAHTSVSKSSVQRASYEQAEDVPAAHHPPLAVTNKPKQTSDTYPPAAPKDSAAIKPTEPFSWGYFGAAGKW
jgi:hypothetical protein